MASEEDADERSVEVAERLAREMTEKIVGTGPEAEAVDVAVKKFTRANRVPPLGKRAP